MKLLIIILLPALVWLFFASCKEFRIRYCEHESDAPEFYGTIAWIAMLAALVAGGLLYLVDKSFCICAAQ